jgi:hypothetical protein
MREYPAYGRTIASHIVRGQKPLAVAVLLSKYWNYFDHVPKVCIKPDEWSLGRYEFGFLHGIHAVVVPGDEATSLQLAELVVDIMRVGPTLVWAYEVDGRALYDGDAPDDVAHWAMKMVSEAGASEKLPWSSVRVATRVMEAAQARSAALWQREYERVVQRGDPDATTRFMLREFEMKDQVRKLFAPTQPVPIDARAA